MPARQSERGLLRIVRVLAGGAVLAASAATAHTLEVVVDDGSGVAVADAVVSVHGAAGVAGPGAEAVMDQREQAFVPGVLAIQAGTSVRFPNSDSVQHQVYSFSPTRPFELPLYAGTPLAPVLFDRPGVVVVGCNIHDFMIGWIVVLDTRWFAVTGADGRVALDVPAGDYTLRVWQPRLKGDGPALPLTVAGDDERRVSLALGPPLPQRRSSDRLRALQDRLRDLRQEKQ